MLMSQHAMCLLEKANEEQLGHVGRCHINGDEVQRRHQRLPGVTWVQNLARAESHP